MKTKTERMEELKNTLLELEEYRTVEDLKGLEEMIDDYEESHKFVKYLQLLRRDCDQAIRTTTGDKQKRYISKRDTYIKALEIIYLFL